MPIRSKSGHHTTKKTKMPKNISFLMENAQYVYAVPTIFLISGA